MDERLSASLVRDGVASPLAESRGRYSVSLFIHVQYIDANGTARILNNSGGFVEVRSGAATAR